MRRHGALPGALLLTSIDRQELRDRLNASSHVGFPGSERFRAGRKVGFTIRQVRLRFLQAVELAQPHIQGLRRCERVVAVGVETIQNFLAFGLVLNEELQNRRRQSLLN